ncbi:MAG: hypothetical protein HZB81_04225 [Deltaproteobacteria bacterium]|nr:hypothetical protein [Deltaproteobacteria bacterium]
MSKAKPNNPLQRNSWVDKTNPTYWLKALALTSQNQNRGEPIQHRFAPTIILPSSTSCHIHAFLLLSLRTVQRKGCVHYSRLKP